MKILLLGDYSAVHKNLKEGLLELGHNVKLASDGDWEKRIPGRDFPLTVDKGGNRFTRKYYQEIQPLLNRQLYGYDIVQAISANLFDWKNRLQIYRKIISRNEQFFCILPGDDYYVYRAWKAGKFRYSSFDDNKEWADSWIGDSVAHKRNEEVYDYVLSRAEGLIPVNPYELEIPYAGMKNLRRYIPFPINTQQIAYQPNTVKNGKIVIYHSTTRPKYKGSSYIEEAMRYIQKKYTDDVECIIRDMVPYTEWLDIMSRANIIVDQCKSYSYGMTAALSMAKGKIVLSGLEPETLSSIATPGCPVLNIKPDTAQIVDTLEKLISQRKDIEEMGYRGRLFVEKEHDYIKVAQMYIEEWNK